MKNILVRLLSLVLCLGMMASCAAFAEESTEYAPVTIENYNSTTEFTQKPTSVVALTLNSAEIIAALGEADSLVAISYNSNTVEEVLPEVYEELKDKNYPDTINGAVPTLENMLSLAPELVVMNYYYFNAPQLFGSAEDYAANGVKFYIVEGSYVSGATVENTYNDIRNLGAIYGRSEEAEALIADMQSRIAAVAEKVAGQEPVNVMALDSVNEDMYIVSGGTGIVNNVIELAGGKNMFADAEGQFVKVSIEEIIARNPELIVVSSYTAADANSAQNTIDYLLSVEELSDVPAIKNQNFLTVPLFVTNPGLQNASFVENLAAAMYPDLFE